MESLAWWVARVGLLFLSAAGRVNDVVERVKMKIKLRILNRRSSTFGNITSSCRFPRHALHPSHDLRRTNIPLIFQYYKLLNIPSTATPDQIRQAYKKECTLLPPFLPLTQADGSHPVALRTHPDRLPAGSTPAQKRAATEKFQAVSSSSPAHWIGILISGCRSQTPTMS